MYLSLLKRIVLAGAALLSVMPLHAHARKSGVDVNVHGVNYSGTEFSYYVVNADEPSKAGVGELINAFSAGGTVCCVMLPKVWQPGIKLQVRTRHWLTALPDGSLPEVKEVDVVEVPKYSTGSPGELWVLRADDGKISVVSSDYQPDHADWPGPIKGWPVASLAYRRERWELLRKQEDNGVKMYISLLADLEKEPAKLAREAWATGAKYDKDSIKGFSGPEDPNYVVSLKRGYTEALVRSRERLRRVTEQRP